jgi:hypothetical protein
VTNEPDFRELVGDEGDHAELDRLRRVHELLVAAGPPPELSPAVANPPEVEESRVFEFKRRRPATLLAVGIAAAAAAFVIGYAVGNHHGSFETQFAVPMHGLGQSKAALADIKVGTHDTGGNYPLEMTVRGLKALPKGGWYELLLSKNGKPTLPCGDFGVAGTETTVRMSVPYDFSDLRAHGAFDGWVVVAHRPGAPTAPVVMST